MTNSLAASAVVGTGTSSALAMRCMCAFHFGPIGITLTKYPCCPPMVTTALRKLARQPNVEGILTE